MNDFDFDAPEEVGGDSNFLTEPGTYHMQVNEVKIGQGPGGNPIQGFTVGLAVLDGTVEAQRDKTINLTFFSGKLTDRDKGLSARKKQAAFMIAANVLQPTQLGQSGLKPNLKGAEGQQVIVKLVVDDYNSDPEHGKVYLTLDWFSVWHVDDPRAKAFPKMAEALALIPKEYRRDESFFAPLLKKREPARQTASAGTTSGKLSKSDLDDL